MRPANIVTAWADVLAGFAAAGAATSNLAPLAWLLLATTGLYGGGVVFNDIFDAPLDAEERPERPIPSGRASQNGAIGLGCVLLMVGVLAAAQVSFVSAVFATGVAGLALLYDAWGKHQSVFGPLNMGLCRGGNLLLGVSAVPASVSDHPFLALIPIFYIAAITAISRGEVHGGKSGTGAIALLLLGVVLGSLLSLNWLPDYTLLVAAPFGILLAVLVLPAFIRATRDPCAQSIRTAVKTGVLSLIVLDATIAAGFAGGIDGLLVLSLLPLSMLLAQLFAVT